MLKQMALVLSFVLFAGPVQAAPAIPALPPSPFPTPKADPIEELLKALMAPKPEEKVVCPKEDKFCAPKYTFDKEVDEESIDSTIKWMDSWEKAGAKALVIEINSPGGSVDDGFRLVKRIEAAKVPVTCAVDGMAASMMAYTLQACTYRVMTDRSTLMFHNPAVAGAFGGDSTKWASMAQMLAAFNEAMGRFCVHRMNVSYEYYKSMTLGASQWWMSVSDSIKYGAVDYHVASINEMMEQIHQTGKFRALK